MIEVDLVAPILLTRAALPALRASKDGLVVNVTSGIALVAAPFYATYAGVKGGLAKFGESLRRELKGEGVHVMTVYPGATDTPMMRSSRAGPELGFTREPAIAVAAAVIEGMEQDAFEVIRGGEARAKMIVGFIQGQRNFRIGERGSWRTPLVVAPLAAGQAPQGCAIHHAPPSHRSG